MEFFITLLSILFLQSSLAGGQSTKPSTLSPTIFRNHALVAAEKKAPVAWVAMDIVPASAGSAGLSSEAPHPHGAVLFIEFLFSPEGQKILEIYEYGSATKDYGFKRWYIEKGMSIQQLERRATAGRSCCGNWDANNWAI